MQSFGATLSGTLEFSPQSAVAGQGAAWKDVPSIDEQSFSDPLSVYFNTAYERVSRWVLVVPAGLQAVGQGRLTTSPASHLLRGGGNKVTQPSYLLSVHVGLKRRHRECKATVGTMS